MQNHLIKVISEFISETWLISGWSMTRSSHMKYQNFSQTMVQLFQWLAGALTSYSTKLLRTSLSSCRLLLATMGKSVLFTLTLGLVPPAAGSCLSPGAPSWIYKQKNPVRPLSYKFLCILKHLYINFRQISLIMFVQSRLVCCVKIQATVSKTNQPQLTLLLELVSSFCWSPWLWPS